MENTAPKHKRTIASLAVCLLGIGLILTGTACPPTPPVCTCTTDADCGDNLFCNGQETCDGCNCVAGTNPCAEGETCDEESDECIPPVVGCASDADCAEGEFCDAVTGDCIPNEQLYENALDNFPHDLAAGGHFAQDCGACHHSEPNAAGKGCLDCHDRDEALFSEEFGTVVPVLQDAMHNPDTGCRACHNDVTDDGLWDCSKCHTALN